MSIDFQEGDLVEMIDCDSIYGYTKSGSTGIVYWVGGNTLAIVFDHLTGKGCPSELPHKYTVDKRYVTLQDGKNTPRKTRLERKIIAMWNRQPYMQRKEYAFHK